MRKLFSALLMCSALLFAQDQSTTIVNAKEPGNTLDVAVKNQEAPKPPPKFYKLNFVVKDMEDGKVVTSREYFVDVSTDQGPRAQIRGKSNVTVGIPGNTRSENIGTDIDCAHVRQYGDDLAFDLVADVTSLLGENEQHPITRDNRWSAQVLIPLKKPTVVVSSDDNTTKRVMQIEVTATPLR